MEYYWRIESQNYHLETKYLDKVRPPVWVWDFKDAKKFSSDTVIDACKWLILNGVSFTVRRFTCV